uniref:T-cell receptor alpha/delta variable 30.0.1 n=1 Tax=Sinocyclocheilus rhinocerous TaxID=307959 RepID=A0A673JH49_9TELE
MLKQNKLLPATVYSMMIFKKADQRQAETTVLSSAFKQVQTAVEGRSVTINCRYETSDLSPYLFWYQQKMNGIPKYMMMIFATTVQNDKEFEERFNANHNKTSKSVPLTIQDVSVSDSAVYYCALRPTVTETHSTLTQKLMVLSYTF